MTTRPNKYSACCMRCGSYLAAGAGHLVATSSGWRVRCAPFCDLPPGAPVIDLAAKPAPRVRVEAGRYAVDLDGEVAFFAVNARGYLEQQASDTLHPVKSAERRRKVFAAIAADPRAALLRYGRELGRCGKCNRGLTSEWRKRGIGPKCAQKLDA